MDLGTMMALEQHGPDTFVGTGPGYNWGGLYGGQIVAQGLAAAGRSVAPGVAVHSLHAYFVRRGDAAEPIRFEVDRVRNGRSFVTRSVVARQSTGAILTMTASFQVDEHGPDVQAAVMPEVPGPATLPAGGWSDVFDRRFVEQPDASGRCRAWMRVTGPLPDEPLLHACGLAYTSDDLPTDALVALHPERTGLQHEFMAASLDHAVWFHRPVRADEWLLQDFWAGGYRGARGMSLGHVFREDGAHVATVAQEVLLRRRA